MEVLLMLLALGAAAGLALAGRAWVRDNFPVRARSPAVAGQATLGVHTLVGHEEKRSPALARTRPLYTTPGGSSLVALIGGYAGNHTPPRDNRDNEWRALGEPVVFEGYEGRFDARAYLVHKARGGPGHRVEVAKTFNAVGELTMPVVEIRDGKLTDVAQVYAPKGTRLTSGTVRTTGPAVLVACWWGDGRDRLNRAVPSDGFRVIEEFVELPINSGVQGSVAAREVDEAGEYMVTWATAPSQGAILWLFAFEHEMR